MRPFFLLFLLPFSTIMTTFAPQKGKTTMKIARILIIAAVSLTATACNSRRTANIDNILTELSKQAEPTIDDSLATMPNSDPSALILQRTAYKTCYNAKARLPHWVAWKLTADHINGSNQRKGIKFHEDEDVPEPRATDADYRSSGYDRGHICPSGDNKWSEQAQLESFLMTNICPQLHNLNAGDWNEMEQQCRRWAEKYGEIYIVSGPILYKSRHKTIGRNKVVVPEAFFKVVLRMGNNPKAIGFVYKNAEGNRPKGDYVNSVDQVERITGIDFFPTLPDDIEQRIEAEASWKDWQ